MKSYKKLEDIFKKLHSIGGAMAILHWDSSIMMPVGGALARSSQLSTLATISHEIITGAEISDLLDGAEQEKTSLNDWQKANLSLMRHSWKHANAVDNDLVAKFSEAGSECEMVWRTARKDDDFETYSKYLSKVVSLSREMATAKAESFGCSMYDALLDQYDMGRKSEEIDIIFKKLNGFLPTFIQSVLEQQSSQTNVSELHGPFSIKKQRDLNIIFMSALGFDFNKGRLDTSIHPFCGGTSSDIRITTKYYEDDFTKGMMGVLHETGHALYEAGLPEEWKNQPVGEALGMTMHESQSLLVEMQVCRSREFLIYAAPIIMKALEKEGSEWEADNLFRIYSRVEPGLIRVDADEVTYPAHIMLRYDIEKSLIEGDMEVEDIPVVWKTKMKELLNVDVPNDKDGCMQDIHWADGSFGYFPTYTLGAMYAAQFFNSIKKENPDILLEIKKGNFIPLIKWLKNNIHSLGSKLPADELLQKATGEDLNTGIYINHLKNRYLS